MLLFRRAVSAFQRLQLTGWNHRELHPVCRRDLIRDAYPAGDLQRLVVHVPDRPGVLAGITQALGAERINIEDFELQHMSPERGGALALLIVGEEAARRAADLLEGQGYGVDVAPAA